MVAARLDRVGRVEVEGAALAVRIAVARRWKLQQPDGVGIFGFGRGLLIGQLGVRLPGQLDTFQLWGQPIYDWAYWGVGGLGWHFFPAWAVSLAVALIGYCYRYAPSEHPRCRTVRQSQAGWSYGKRTRKRQVR